MSYIGPTFARVNKNDVFTFKFTMTVADVPTTLTNTPTVKAYEEGNATEFTGGITLNVDYDGKVGLNELIIDTSNAAYSAGKNYDFFFSAGSIGVVTLVGTGFFHLATIPDPADIRAVNGGSTGATAGKLELTSGLFVTGAIGAPALKLTGGAADASNQAGAGLLVVGGAASAAQLSSPGMAVYGGAGTATKAAGAGLIVGPGVSSSITLAAPVMAAISAHPSTYGGHAEFDSSGTAGISGLVIDADNHGTGVVIASKTAYGVSTLNDSGVALLVQSGNTDYASAIVVDAFAGGNGYNALQLGARRITDDDIGGAGVVIFGADASATYAAGPGLSFVGGAAYSDTVQEPGNGIDLAAGPIFDSMFNIIGAGKGISATGQVYIAPINPNDDALKLVPNGAGESINAPVESGADLIQSLLLANAANAGKTNGMATATVHLRDLADTKNRITATCDTDGNRTAVTRDVT